MIYQLKNTPNSEYSITEQILINRGINREDIRHYLNTTDKDIYSPLLFGEDKMRAAAAVLIQCIQNNTPTLVVVDPDCDGYTSSAILINYLYDLFPSFVENYLSWFHHEGKQHGLSDVINAKNYGLVIAPDSSSNNYTEHLELANLGIPVIVLDHHEAEISSPNAIVINNQLSDYPDKALTGAGVTWQFCRYLDSLLDKNYADQYRDLVALGNMADMANLTELETKHLITTGFRDENLKNPFIVAMAEKNAYSLGGKITPMGAAFYIAPFVNAMVRSGTQEEKELLFQSMLKFKAFEKVPSTKRGHKLGEMENIVDQAIRTATNVKSRQTRSQDAMLETLEKKIQDENLLDHKVLLFLFESSVIEKNIAGLCANKIMAKYQRPCCILTRSRNENNLDVYQGSARGCNIVGVTQFKDICESAPNVTMAQGHQGAFGLSIRADGVQDFINYTDTVLQDMAAEPVYYVDLIYDNFNFNGQDILDVTYLDDLWGQGMPEPYIALRNIRVTKDMVTVYVKKNNTLKITLPNKVNIMLFCASDELCDMLQNKNPGHYCMDFVCRCHANEWNGTVTPQLFIEDYEIKSQLAFSF